MQSLPAILSVLVCICFLQVRAAPVVYEKAVRDTIQSVIPCSNPEILLAGPHVAEVDHEAYFRETGRVAWSFREIALGPGIAGYRADLVPCGQGWSGVRHARLFELRDGRLVQVFELAGPYLWVGESATVNGRYLLSHWIGCIPHAAVKQYYVYHDGRYVSSTKGER